MEETKEGRERAEREREGGTGGGGRPFHDDTAACHM